MENRVRARGKLELGCLHLLACLLSCSRPHWQYGRCSEAQHHGREECRQNCDVAKNYIMVPTGLRLAPPTLQSSSNSWSMLTINHDNGVANLGSKCNRNRDWIALQRFYVIWLLFITSVTGQTDSRKSRVTSFHLALSSRKLLRGRSFSITLLQCPVDHGLSMEQPRSCWRWVLSSIDHPWPPLRKSPVRAMDYSRIFGWYWRSLVHKGGSISMSCIRTGVLLFALVQMRSLSRHWKLWRRFIPRVDPGTTRPSFIHCSSSLIPGEGRHSDPWTIVLNKVEQCSVHWIKEL